MYTLGVSHSNRWMICQAAPRMASLSPSIEQTADTSRNEGLDGHHVAELVLKSNGVSAPREFVGQQLPHGTVFTLDHAIAVGVYVQDVLDITQHCSEPLLVEDRNDLTWLGPGIVAIVDAAAYDKTSRHITVWDLKFGHSPRDPQYDWQMIGNGLAIAYKYPEAQRIDLRIVQPNVYGDEPIKSWELDVDELKQYGARMRVAAEAIQTGNSPAVPGVHCRGCRAAHTCPSLEEYNKRLGATLQESLRTQPSSLTPQEISLELDVLSALTVTVKARKEAQDAYAYQLADRQAVNVPGYKLVSKRTQRRITDPSTFVETARTFGYSDALLHNDPKLLSPAQLESVGVNKELVEMFTEKPDVGKQLAPMSDKRPAQAAELLERFKSVSR
ncbi:protein of unknown function DUF2800 [Vibrio phage 1.088.O._10N.261.46.A1]|nr:protein of unknown function DUF2800 [Vibrio phage 1.088.O._10N.261.46.A1]